MKIFYHRIWHSRNFDTIQFIIENKTETKEEIPEQPRPESRGVDWKTQVRPTDLLHFCFKIIICPFIYQ